MTASPPSCAMTIPPARRCCMRRIPAMSGCRWAAPRSSPIPACRRRTDVSGRAHAGCLSFEMSSGRHNFIVNSGVDTFGAPDFRPLARATAAHSTATLNDTSSARFNNSTGVNALIGAPLVAGPKHVPCERQDGKDTQGFVAVHDGYVSRFGIYHERALSLVARRQRARRHRPVLPGRRQAAPQQRPRLRRHPLPRASRDRTCSPTRRAGSCSPRAAPTPGSSPLPASSRWSRIRSSSPGLSGPRKSRQIVLAFKASEVRKCAGRLSARTRARQRLEPKTDLMRCVHLQL